MEFEVYEVGNSFGYRILSGGVVLIAQEFDPELEGFETMSEERAEQLATDYIASYIPPVIEDVPTPKTAEQLRIEQLEDELATANLQIIDIWETILT